MASFDDLSKGIQKGNDKLSERKGFVEIDEKGKGNAWEAQQIETKSDPIVDPGTGGGVIVRNFFFKAPPREKGQKPASKTEIFSGFKQMIEISLWSDGLEPLMDKQIHVYNRKELKPNTMLRRKMLKEGADFVIMILAKPRMGVQLADTPQLLNQS